MTVSTALAAAVLAGVVFAGAACTDRAVNQTKKNAGAALDVTKAGADKAIDATRKAGDEAAGVTKEVASAAGAALTDGSITTKVTAKFADESVLNNSHITVDTTDHVVTLRGTVVSEPAKARAFAIALGTERVTRVVNHLVVE